MVIAFANNQTMVAATGTPSQITTDPVPLNGNDRGTAHLFVESMFNGTSIAYQAQVSLDGTNWVDVSGFTDSASAATTDPLALTSAVHGAFLRFVLTFTASASIGGCTFDLHVLLDHV